MGGEGLLELGCLPLGERRVIGSGCGSDRRPGVPLWMTGFGILGRLERGEMSGAHRIVGPALDLRPALGGERAFAGREYRGQAVERVALLIPKSGPGQTRGDGPEPVTDGDRAWQFRLLGRIHANTAASSCGDEGAGWESRAIASAAAAQASSAPMTTGGAVLSGEFAARAKVSLAALIAAACSFHSANAALPSQVGSAMPDPVPNSPQ